MSGFNQCLSNLRYLSFSIISPETSCPDYAKDVKNKAMSPYRPYRALVNKALLDTDIYSEILKAVNPTVARNAIAYRQAMGYLTLSAITVMEIMHGFQREENARMPRLPARHRFGRSALFDRAAADLAGRIAGDLDRIGQPIGTSPTR